MRYTIAIHRPAEYADLIDEAVETIKCIGKGVDRIVESDHNFTFYVFKRIKDRQQALVWLLRFCCDRGLPQQLFN